MSRNISFIINTVNSCNLNCAYCYSPKVSLNKIETISQDILIELIKGSVNLGIKNVQFVWHGSEPTLAGIGFFKKALLLQRKFGEPWQNYENVMQSNGTRLDENWIKFFKKNNIGVGLSIDGPSFIHNMNRKTIEGKPTHKIIEDNYKLLMNYNHGGGICSVINKDSLGKANQIVSYFNKLSVPTVDFLQCFPSIDTDSSFLDKSVTPKEFGEFLINAFDYWWELDNPV